MIEYKNRITEALEHANDLSDKDKRKVERCISILQRKIKAKANKLNRLKLEINEKLDDLEDLIAMLIRLEGDSIDIELLKELTQD